MQEALQANREGVDQTCNDLDIFNYVVRSVGDDQKESLLIELLQE